MFLIDVESCRSRLRGRLSRPMFLQRGLMDFAMVHSTGLYPETPRFPRISMPAGPTGLKIGRRYGLIGTGTILAVHACGIID